MEIETVESWRELDEAIEEAGTRSAGRHVHPTLVFRGLARADGVTAGHVRSPA